MKILNPKFVIATAALALTSVGVAKDFTMEEIDEAIAYATKREKPLIYIDGHL